MNTKAFPTADVLTTITGRVLAERGIDGVYQVLNFMTGESLMTHQLGRVSKEATIAILQQHPELTDTITEAEAITGENWKQWRDLWIKRYGKEITLSPMTEDQHERIDPISELSEMVHPDKIITVAI